jgi:hypothetical protein
MTTFGISVVIHMPIIIETELHYSRRRPVYGVYGGIHRAGQLGETGPPRPFIICIIMSISITDSFIISIIIRRLIKHSLMISIVIVTFRIIIRMWFKGLQADEEKAIEI